MEETYERHLAEIVAAMPKEPCVVALVPTIPLQDAAALASDVAQRVGKSRRGHTILTSFESYPSCIDHEIGVEGGKGLTEVLSKDVSMAGAAAPGAARGFIYLPAGGGALRGEVLLRSEAWRMLSASVVKSGGTVLAVVPPTVFTAVNEGRSEGAGRRFDAVVWLGGSRRSQKGVQLAAIASGARDLGGVQLPSGPGGEEDRRATPDRRAPTERRRQANRRATSWQAVQRPPISSETVAEAPPTPRTSATAKASSSAHAPQTAATPNGASHRPPTSIVGLTTQLGHGPRRRALDKRRRRNRIVLIVLGVFVAACAAVFVIQGQRSSGPAEPGPRVQGSGP